MVPYSIFEMVWKRNLYRAKSQAHYHNSNSISLNQTTTTYLTATKLLYIEILTFFAKLTIVPT